MSLKRCLLRMQEWAERLLMSTFAVVLAVIMLLPAQVQAGPPGQKVDDPYTFHGSEALPSGLIIVDVIDDLESDSSAHWSFNIGSDLYSETEFQWKPEQYAGASLALRCWPKDLEVLERTWCHPSRNVTPTPAWAEAEAIRVSFAWKKDIGHWMALYIDTASGSSFKHIINIGYGEYTIVNKVLNFSEFEAESGPDETIDPTQITKIAIGSSIGGNANNLYIHHLDLLRWFTRDSWLETSSSQPWNNLFEPGEPVTLTFAPGGTVPSDATGFRYEVQDYFGEIAAEGIVSWLAGQLGDEYQLDLGNLTGSGYYEVRAYWEGIDPPEQEFSIILEAPGGTMPFGLHTFAIMPQSKAQNRVEANESSFFGFHGPTPDLNCLMGNTWTLGSPRWDYIESTQPVRSSPDYMAQWAKDSIAQGPAPVYEFYLVNFVPMSTPDWVSQDNFFQDNWAHWADYEAFVRDMVRVQVARYPHVEHRVYDFMWEVNLYMDTGREPNMSVEQVMNVYERVRPIVLEEDPDALIIGVCPSQPGMNADWWIPFFEAGVLDYLDGLSLHPYHSVAPENARIPTVVHDIEALTAQYNDGVTLPIWMTEWGYQSMQGGVSDHHRDGQYRVRANLILQGTGARASMPFFGRDFDAPWGVMFRLGEWQGFPQVDPLAPKPSVVALAVQSALLDGATPTGNLNGLGGDAQVWGYTFEDGGRNIFVIWRTNHDDALVDLPIPAGVNQVIVYDMMGQSRVEPVNGSTLSMRLSMDVQYVVFADPSAQNSSPTVYAGEDISTYLGVPVTISGSILDDGLPIPPGRVITTWSLVSGPGMVDFTNFLASTTTAVFSVEGSYVLRLTADDNELSGDDTVIVNVGLALPPGLTGHWKLDESSGVKAKDWTVTEQNGTLLGDFSFDDSSVTGPLGNALHFDGVDDRITLTEDATFEVGDAITLSAWAKIDNVTSENKTRVILGKWYHHAGIMINENGYIFARLYLNNGSFATLWSGIRVDTGWHFYAVTYDPSVSGNNFKLYRDDTVIKESALSADLNHTGSWGIGWNGNNGGYFNGAIDDVRIYSRGLEQAEIEALFDSGWNQPPAVNAGIDQSVSVSTECIASITLDGSGSSDPDGDPLIYNWSWDGGSASGVNPVIQLPLGTFTITLVVNDGTVDSEPDNVIITVIDPMPPEISVSVNPDTLWPPNHKMVLITPIITVSDNCDSNPVIKLESITINEGDETDTYDPTYDDTVGDGHTVNDIQIDEEGDIYLRAERSGTGSGRNYTITYTVTDASGNSSSASVEVTVPHEQDDTVKL